MATSDGNSQLVELERLMKEYEALRQLKLEIQVQSRVNGHLSGIKTSDPDEIREQIVEADVENDRIKIISCILKNISRAAQVGTNLAETQGLRTQLSVDIEAEVEQLERLSSNVLKLSKEAAAKEENVENLKRKITSLIEKQKELEGQIKSVSSGTSGVMSEHTEELLSISESHRLLRGNYQHLRFMIQSLLMAGKADFIANPKLANLLYMCGEELSDEDDI